MLLEGVLPCIHIDVRIIALATGTFFLQIFLGVVLCFFDNKIFQIVIIWNILAIFVVEMSKVIHVHLICPIDGTTQRDWYFSSISAVYSVFTPDQVGASKSYLLHAGLSGNGSIITKKAIIKQSTLIRGSRDR